MNISIYVTYHKKVKMLTSSSFLKYILCGADKNYEENFIPDTLTDNVGENIANLNKHFCECTAIYWAWKNDRVSDYIGIMHYRRFLNLSGNQAPGSIDTITNDTMERFRLTDLSINNICSNNTLILPYPEIFRCSVYDQYKRCAHVHDYDLAIDLINDKYPYLSKTALLINRANICYTKNIFIMRRDIFLAYCQFLFDILLELHNLIDYSSYSDYHMRTPAFVAERISSLYFCYLIMNKEVAFYELPITFVKYPFVSEQ